MNLTGDTESTAMWLAFKPGAGDTLIDEVKARLAGRLLTEL